MTRVIVRRPSDPYVGAVLEALAKLLLMVAVLFMPFGMAAPAAAATHPAAASSTMRHCPDEGTADHHRGGVDACTMACAAALPAIAVTADRLLPLRPVPTPRILAEPLPSLHPETATPPPRHA